MKILVIDDDVTSPRVSENREAAYKSLSSQPESQCVEIIFARSPADAQEKLLRDSFDIVMLDVWLKREPFTDDERGTVFEGLFLAASKASVVALVSNDWDNTVVPRVNRLLLNNSEIPVPLMFNFDELRKNHHAAVMMQIQAHIMRRRGGLFLELSEDNPLHIVHISDLHFGSKYSEETLAGEANLDALASALMRASNGTPHFIAVTGDVSNTGHPDEYSAAYDWLKRLCNELAMPLPNRRILLVPGNHDFSLPVAQSIRLHGSSTPPDKLSFSFGDVDERSRKLARYATHGFNEFAAHVTGMASPPASRFDKCWVEAAFREYGVVFSGLNTCGRVKDDGWPDCWLDHNDSIRIAKEVRALNTQSIFHVMLSHHPPVQTSMSRQPITNTNDFVTHFLAHDDCRPNVILHGHEHARRGEMPWRDRTLVACAPTPSCRESGRPPDSLRGVNLVTLNRTAGIVVNAKARSIVYEGTRWKVSDLDPHSEVKHRFKKKPASRSTKRPSRVGGVAKAKKK